MADETNGSNQANGATELAPGEDVFKLNKTKEIADRFRGDHEIRYMVPVAVPGDVDATLANIRAFVAPDADFATVLVQKFNGQGFVLDVQKRIKDALAPGAVADDVSVEEALRQAGEAARGFRLGVKRERTAGTGKATGKLAQAEAKLAQVSNTTLELYRAMKPAQRAQMREMILASGAVTAEQLDAVDAPAQA